MPPRTPGFSDVAIELVELARRAHARGWLPGTSGNLSATVSLEPLRLAITPTGVDKAVLAPEQILLIDAAGQVLRGQGRPTAEAAIHVTIARRRRTGAIAHTHSAWSTLLSDLHGRYGGLAIQGYEMLKGLRGVTSHQHEEWLPIVSNSQDWPSEAAGLASLLDEHPQAHGLLIERHGLYTWGEDVEEAGRHLEVLEFLLEVRGRALSLMSPG
jgi:methylthioribulose-1-phosphate dehydratase